MITRITGSSYNAFFQQQHQSCCSTIFDKIQNLVNRIIAFFNCCKKKAAPTPQIALAPQPVINHPEIIHRFHDGLRLIDRTGPGVVGILPFFQIRAHGRNDEPIYWPPTQFISIHGFRVLLNGGQDQNVVFGQEYYSRVEIENIDNRPNVFHIRIVALNGQEDDIVDANKVFLSRDLISDEHPDHREVLLSERAERQIQGDYLQRIR